MSGQSGSGDTAVEVKNRLEDDLIDRASDSGVDVDSIIENTVEEYADYSAPTVVRFARSSISTQIEAAESESMKGLIAGSRDRFGKNWPRRISVVRSNGEHIEASTWSGSLPMASGGKTEIPNGAAVTLRCDYDSEYDSWEAEALDSVDELEQAEFASRLESVARSPSELGRDDEYEVVVVRGSIDYVNPQTVFEDGEPIGPGEVLMPDEDGAEKPHLEIVMDDPSGVRVRGHIERQRYGQPMVALADADLLLHDAVKNHTTPDEQASFIMDAFRSTEVVMVGNVNSFDTDRSDGETRSYVDIAVSAVVEIPESGGVSESASETESESDATEASDPGEFESESDDDGSDGDGGGEPEGTSATGQVGDVVDDIETYCELTGEDAASLDAGTVKEKIKSVDAPETVISVALDRITGDAEAPESGDGDGDDSGTPEDIEEALAEGDMLVCPGEDCIASSPSLAGLCGHVADQHNPDSTPKEWIEGRV